jgi:hypothetical protein
MRVHPDAGKLFDLSSLIDLPVKEVGNGRVVEDDGLGG